MPHTSRLEPLIQRKFPDAVLRGVMSPSPPFEFQGWRLVRLRALPFGAVFGDREEPLSEVMASLADMADWLQSQPDAPPRPSSF